MSFWRLYAVPLVGLLLLADVPASAQSLNEVVAGRLSFNCRGLSGPGIAGSFPPPNNFNPDYGPQLLPLCGNTIANQGSAGASSGGGIDSAEDRVSSLGAEQAIRRRSQERRADSDRGLGLFFTADYERFEQDTTRFESGFGRDTVGGTGGIDYILNRFVLLGLGVAYAHEFGNYISGGGFDHNRYGVFLYTSLSPMPAAFVDLVAGYVRKEYHFERRVSLDIQQATGFVRHVEGPTRADTHGDEFRISAYGGYDFILLRNITVGPRLGVSYKDATIDRYRESGGTGVELGYDNQNIVSLTTQAGVYASMAINTGVGVLVPQTTIEYIHEFMDDQRSVGFTFNQDLRGRRFLFQTDPPDRDYVNVAVGASMLFPGGVTGFANFRELVGYRDRTSHAVTLGVRFAF